MLTLRIQDEKTSKRSKDSNGFLIIKDNPIAKAGVFDYLLSELNQDIEPKDDKIVKVYRPFSELVRIKESFANKPVKMNHHWVGDECETADGAIGSNIIIDEANEYLRADLIIYNPKLIEAIEKDELVELSPAYTGKEIVENGRYNGEAYQYKQELGEVNHLAVVQVGRSGKDLKIYDSKSNIGAVMKFKDMFIAKLSKFIDSEMEAKADEAESIAESEINIDEIAEAVAEVVEKVTEQKLKEFADSQRKEAKKISDAYSEVKKALGSDFDSKNMSVDEIYKFGYEALSKTTLDKKMDSKTAFLLALDGKKAPSQKVADSGESLSSNILNILKNKY